MPERTLFGKLLVTTYDGNNGKSVNSENETFRPADSAFDYDGVNSARHPVTPRRRHGQDESVRNDEVVQESSVLVTIGN